MRKWKVILALLLVVMVGLTVASELYRRGFEDTTPPKLVCDSDVLEVSVQADQAALLQGVTATDNKDGDLTGEILVDHVSTLVTSDTAIITYVVFDSANNAAKATRTIRYTDYKAPRFRLTKPLCYPVGSTVTLLDRLSVEDVVDGDITGNVRMTTQNLNTAIPGIYTLTLQVTNSLGDTVVLPLSVVIQAGSNAPEIQLKEYLIYLPVGGAFDPADYLRKVTENGRGISSSDVDITSHVDTTQAGVYEVLYQYQGTGGLGTAVLTVVVE